MRSLDKSGLGFSGLGMFRVSGSLDTPPLNARATPSPAEVQGKERDAQRDSNSGIAGDRQDEISGP